MCAHHTICFFDSLLETLLDRQHTFDISSKDCNQVVAEIVYTIVETVVNVMKGLDYILEGEPWIDMLVQKIKCCQ